MYSVLQKERRKTKKSQKGEKRWEREKGEERKEVERSGKTDREPLYCYSSFRGRKP